jgi:hypothetical protein
MVKGCLGPCPAAVLSACSCDIIPPGYRVKNYIRAFFIDRTHYAKTDNKKLILEEAFKKRFFALNQEGFISSY